MPIEAVSLTAVIGSEIPLGGSVVVLGPGPLGLMSAKLARLRGAGFVAITGLRAGNIKFILSRARANLRAIMGDKDE
jgi:threonine dehydrogenase-like Zn-dependent dehydrogenase